MSDTTRLIDDLTSTANTNTVAKPATMTKETLDRAMEMLRKLPPESERLDHFKAGGDYWRWLKGLAPLPQPPLGMVGGFMGVNIFIDEALPPNVMEARSKDGKVLERFELEEGQ
jgi:hypothetical protein